MDTDMKLRHMDTMLERDAAPLLKLKENDDDRQSAVDYFQWDEFLPSDFGFRVLQRDVREVASEIDQACRAENSSITSNTFKLNPCSKEFIPLSKQKHLIYQFNSAQSMILNPSAAEFIPQSRNLSSRSSTTDDKNINLQQTSAASYTDYTALTSGLLESAMTCPNGVSQKTEDIQGKWLDECVGHVAQDNIKTAGYSQQESQSTETQKLNPCAEIFMPQLKNPATVSLHTYNKNHKLEKMHAVSDLHKTPMATKLTKSLCIRLHFVTARSEDTIANSLHGRVTTDAVGDAEMVSLSQQVPIIDQSQAILSGKLNPNAAEFAPLSRYQTSLTTTKDKNHEIEETGGALCLDNIPINLNMTESFGTDVHDVTSQSADIAGKVLDECIYTTVEDGSQTVCLSQSNQGVYQSQTTEPRGLNPCANAFVPKLRNRSISNETDELSQNVQQKRSALDVESTPLTSKPRGSLSSRRGNAKLRSGKTFLMRLNECIADAAETDIKTACQSQQESEPTESQKLNPCAGIFISKLKNLSPASLTTDNKSNKEIPESSHLYNTAVTVEQISSLSIRLNYVTPRSEDTVGNLLDERVTTDVEEPAEMVCLSQQVPLINQSQPKLSGNLNPRAAEFAPLSRFQSSLTNTEDNNHDMQETGGALCLDNIPIIVNMTESFGTDVHDVTSQSADIGEKVLYGCISVIVEDDSQTVCFSQKEQSVCQSQVTELSQKEHGVYQSQQTDLSQKEREVYQSQETEPRAFNPCANAFVPQLRNRPSISNETVKLRRNVQQKRSALDLESTPLTTKPRGPLSSRRMDAKFRSGKTCPMRLNECIADVPEADVGKALDECISSTVEDGSQTVCLSQKEQSIYQSQQIELSQKEQGVYQSRPTETRALNPCANAFIPNLRNRPSISHETDEPSQNVQQKRSALDLESTPLTSKPRGSLSSCRGNAKLRSGKTFLMRLNECIADAAEADMKPACHSQQESEPTESQKLNPCAGIFIPKLKNLCPASLTTDNKSNKEIHEASDLCNTAVTVEQISSLSIRLNCVTPRSEDTVGNLLDERVTTDVEEPAETVCLSQKVALIHQSYTIFSGNLNTNAAEFIQESRKQSSLPNIDDKTHKMEESSGALCMDNIPFISNLTKSFSTGVHNVTARSANIVGKILDECIYSTVEDGSRTVCFSQEEQGVYQSQQTKLSQKEQGVYQSQPTELSQKDHGIYQSQQIELSQKDQDVVQSRPTESRALNPFANAFISNTRNRPTISHETDEPSQNVQQKRSALDLESTPLTSKPRGSLSSCRGNAKLRSGKTFLMRLNECIADAAEADIKTACQSQQESEPTESQKLNPCAGIFIPKLKNLSPASLTTDKKSNKEIPEASDLDNIAITVDQISSLSIRLNCVTPRPEDTVANWLDKYVTTDVEDDPETSCLSQQMDLIHQSQAVLSANLNPSADDFIPHSRNLSSLSPSTEDKKHTVPLALNPRAKSFILQSGNMSSDKTQSCILKNSGALSAISRDTYEAETEHSSPSHELSQGQLQPSVSAYENIQRENTMARDAAMSISAHVGDDKSTLHSTTTSPTIAEINNQLPVNSDLPNNDFRRTPRHIYQGCLRFDAEVDQPEINETDSENQYKVLQTLNNLQFPRNDDFLDIANQQFSAWYSEQLDQDAPVTDQSECDLRNLVARAERAEMEAERWKLKVSSLTMDHAMEKTRYQLYIKDLHKQMEEDDMTSINMQMHMLDLTRQVTIERIDKKLQHTDHHVRQLYEALGNNAMTEREVQSTYKVLCSYMTDCNVLKVEVETLARDLQEKLEFGVDVDMSGMDKHPPSFPELIISLSLEANERRRRNVLR